LARWSSIPTRSTRRRFSPFGSPGIIPLPDGNKRLAWQALTMFLALNGWALKVPTGDAVSAVLAVAAGELNEEVLAAWLRERAERLET